MLKKQFARFFWFVVLGAGILSVYEVFLRFLQGADLSEKIYAFSFWWEFYKIFFIIILVAYLLSWLIKEWGFWIATATISAVFIDMFLVSRIQNVIGLNAALPLAWYYIYTLGLIRILAEYCSGERSDVPKWGIWVFGSFLIFDLGIKILIYLDILPKVNFGLF